MRYSNKQSKEDTLMETTTYKKRIVCPHCGSPTRIQLNANNFDYSGIGCTNSTCMYFKSIPTYALKELSVNGCSGSGREV